MTLEFRNTSSRRDGKMKGNLSRYTLRVDQTLLDKLGYIAE